MFCITLMACCLLTSASADAKKNLDINTLDASLARLAALGSSRRAAIELWAQRGQLERCDQADLDKLVRAWTRLADETKAPVELRRLALQNLQKEALQRADLARAEALAKRLGWIRDWWLLGPLDLQAKGPLAKLAQLGGLDIKDSWPGKLHPVSWRKLRSPRADGRMDLHAVLQPDEEIQALALHPFETKTSGRYQIFVGCDDGCSVWLDGELLIEEPGPHALRPDQRAVEVSLDKGPHQLLVQLEQHEGSMGFVLGMTAVDKKKATKNLAGLGQWFMRRAEAEPENPEALAEAGRAMDFAATEDPASGRMEKWIKQALDLLPKKQRAKQLRYRLWLARATDDDDLARRLLTEAITIAPNSAEAMMRLGTSQHIRGLTPLALVWHERAIKADPELLTAQIERCEVLMALGRQALAKNCITALVKKYPLRPDVLASAGALLRQAGLWSQARKHFQALTKLRPGSSLAVRALLELSLQAGLLEPALKGFAKLRALEPWRIDHLMEEADLLLANGRAQQALGLYEQILALSPDETRAMQGQGEVWMALAQPKRAMAAWREALKLMPQNRSLERRVLAAESRSHRFFDSEVQDAQQLAKNLDPIPGAGSERLLDLHVVRLHPNGMTSRYRQQIIRILDPRDADKLKTLRVEYAPGRQEVRVLRSRVLHPDGSSDASVVVRDFSLSEPWYNLYYDVHAREITFPSIGPGDVIELATLVDDIGSDALFPGYFGDLIALQFSEPARMVRYVLLAPERFALHFNQTDGLEHRIEPGPQAGLKRHSWWASDMPGVEPEISMPGYTESHRVLHLSSENNWEALSRWFHRQIRDSLKSDTGIQELAKKLTQGLDKPKDRIRAIYRFVADSTRYVGLEFGIHSFVPYAAPQVLRRKFGDCKDKSALLVALFRSVGIQAELALVRMQRLGEVEPQPASLAVFNHAICYLPEHDLWLDGTATLHSVKDLPPQDQGVQALVISEKGAPLKLTPESKSERNHTALEFYIHPGKDGAASIDSRIELSGALAPEVRMQYLGGTAQAQLFGQTIREIFPGASVRSVQADNLRDPSKPVIMRAQVDVPKLGQRETNSAAWPLLGKATSYQRNMASFETRRHDLILGPAWSVRWRVRHDRPSGMQAGPLPQPATIQTAFGTAKLALRQETGTLVAEAELRITVSRVSATDYPAFRDFLGQADRLFGQTLHFAGGAHAH
ncbi:MAG: DUF3857 domain-containing protein [Deltaproteobacteria bacterium]|nr:DUF3857 domain-containing protein [Deltaproteobacteria bacterium]